MKHFVVKVLVVLVGLFALPRLQAQDTTITIYGKKFAPGVIVKLNGKTIDSVRHDSAQPSRILYVKIKLSDLRTSTPVIAGAKDAGGSLTSSTDTNIISLKNPEPSGAETYFPIQVLQNRSIFFTLPNSTTRVKNLILSNKANKDTTIKLWLRFSNIPLGQKFLAEILPDENSNGGDAAYFNFLDSTGQPLTTITAQIEKKYIPVQLRLLQQNSNSPTRYAVLRISPLNIPNNLVINEIELHLQGRLTEIQTIKVLAAYTKQNKQGFIASDNKYNFDPIRDTISNPKIFLADCISTLNHAIEISSLSDTSAFSSKRFALVEEPFEVSFIENSPDDHLHIDIDALQDNLITDISNGHTNNADITILLVNTITTPYKAIASGCDETKFPRYIIVEQRYVRDFINPNLAKVNPSFFEEIRNILNK